MKKIIITGATGMIGSAIASCAIAQGCEVLCIIKKGSKRKENLLKSNQITVIEVDLEAYADLKIKNQYDEFYHLAWANTYGESRDDVNIQFKNIEYTLDAVRLAYRCGCKVFIGAGSQAEYGIASEPLTLNTSINPKSGYGIAKYAAGKFSNLLCTQLGMRQNWIRILSVYGPNDAPHTLIMYVINELKNGRSPELTKCEQIWDYIHCDDVAHAFLAVGKYGLPDKSYPLGSGIGKKISEYIKIIRDMINPEIELVFGKREYFPYQPMYLVAEISELTKDTGWRPIIAYKDGINEILKIKGLVKDK